MKEILSELELKLKKAEPEIQQLVHQMQLKVAKSLRENATLQAENLILQTRVEIAEGRKFKRDIDFENMSAEELAKFIRTFDKFK